LCTYCKGRGKLKFFKICNICKGTGICIKCDGECKCTLCKGIGKCNVCVGLKVCKICGGTGRCYACKHSTHHDNNLTELDTTLIELS
jgi:hypothetical protein